MKTKARGSKPVTRPRVFTTKTAIQELICGFWLTDTKETVVASFLRDEVLVNPRCKDSRVAIAEAATFPIEDFEAAYAGTRWRIL